MNDLFFTLNGDTGIWTQHYSREIPLQITHETMPMIWWNGCRLSFEGGTFVLCNNTFFYIPPDDEKLLKIVSERGWMNFEEMCKIWKGITS